jgi:protein subunit release factor B
MTIKIQGATYGYVSVVKFLHIWVSKSQHSRTFDPSSWFTAIPYMKVPPHQTADRR